MTSDPTCSRLAVVDNDDMRVVITFDSETGNHIVEWWSNIDPGRLFFQESGRLSVGELRYALVVAGMVVESISKGRHLPTADSLEFFDMKWAQFVYDIIYPIAADF